MESMAESLASWNSRINVVSRKDIENLIGRHYLPSLALLNLFRPPEVAAQEACRTLEGAHIIDVGTGGGFPGLPLALACPEVIPGTAERFQGMNLSYRFVLAADMISQARFTLVDSRSKKLQVRYPSYHVRALLRPRGTTNRHRRAESAAHSL